MERPVRPSVPPALGALACVLAGEQLLLRDMVVPAFGLCLLALPAAGACVLWGWRRGTAVRTARSAVALTGALVMGCALGGMRAEADATVARRLGDIPISSCRIEVIGDPRISAAGGLNSRGRVHLPDGATADVWLGLPEEAQRGSTLSCVGRFAPNEDDAWGMTSAAQGIIGRVRVVSVRSVQMPSGPYCLILRLRQRMVRAMGAGESGEGALVAGSVGGYAAALSSFGIDGDCARAGVSHLVAVSGGHLVILTWLIMAALSHTRLQPAPRIALLQVACGLFVLFCGLPVSAVRSWAMCGVAGAAQLVGRRSHGTSAAALAGLALALLDPAVSGQLSFLLSLASVLALCLFARYGAYALEELLVPRALRRTVAHLPRAARAPLTTAGEAVRDTVAATLCCQVATLPLTIQAFGQVSLVAPLANLVLGPPFALMIGSGVLGYAAATVPPLEGVAFAPARWVSRAVLRAVRLLAGMPCASIPAAPHPLAVTVVVATCALGLYLTWPHVRRRAVARALALGLAIPTFVVVQGSLLAPARICVLDVGQGDAILIQDGPHALLVDTGPDASAAHGLARLGVLRLDGVLLTHLHDDHVGGLDELAVPLGRPEVLVARGVAPSMGAELREAVHVVSGADPVEVSWGDAIHVGRFTLVAIWPRGRVSGNENRDSLELALSYDADRDGVIDFTGLLTGDAERDETAAALQAAHLGSLDFLKVGHHGSRVSLSQELASRLSPGVAVASAGEGNEYGHPDPTCVSLLKRAGASFYCTKDVGTVTLLPRERGCLVRTERGAERGGDVS